MVDPMCCFPQEGAILHVLPQDTFVPRPYPLWKALPLVFFTCSQNRSTAAGQRECPVHPRLDPFLSICISLRTECGGQDGEDSYGVGLCAAVEIRSGEGLDCH